MKEPFKISYLIFKPFIKLLYTLYYNPKIEGKENIPKKGPIIISGNHIHIMDQFNVMISTKRMIHYMAKKEYFDSKFAFFFKLAGCISVNRQIKDENAKKEAIQLLEKGYAVGIFPEGTRNKTKEKLLPFKFGAISLASKTNAYIVPFGITGNYKFRSKNLHIKIGKPFKIENITYEDANEKLRNEILYLITKN